MLFSTPNALIFTLLAALLVLAVILDVKHGRTPDPIQDSSAEDNRCFFV